MSPGNSPAHRDPAIRAYDVEALTPVLLDTMSHAVRAASEELHRLVDETPG